MAYEILKMKLLLLFINALFSITNANHAQDGDDEMNLERRSGVNQIEIFYNQEK